MSRRANVFSRCRSGSERAALLAKASVNPSGLDVLAAAAALQLAPTPRQVGRVDGVSVVPAPPRYSVVASAIQTVAIAPSHPVFDGLAQLMSLLDG